MTATKKPRTKKRTRPDPALVALRIAVKKAIVRHFRLGNPVAVYEDGQAVWLHPDGHKVPIRFRNRKRGK